MSEAPSPEYHELIAHEGRKWGGHLDVEADGGWWAWTDHPLIRQHFTELATVDGVGWEAYVQRHLGRPAHTSLDLGCGAGMRSRFVWEIGSVGTVEGLDVSADRVAEAERWRNELGLPGGFRVEDVNTVQLPKNKYDLVFSAHSFHHFVELEHICAQVHDSLTDDGIFVLEEFVGPTQFQWTDLQIGIVKSLLAMVPDDLRQLRWGATKLWEGRPTVEEVVAESPFESIRSAEILPIFQDTFEVVALRPLGGTLQHLLYNGIMHNFVLDDPRTAGLIEGIYGMEDSLITAGVLPSDFMLLVGRKRA